MGVCILQMEKYKLYIDLFLQQVCQIPIRNEKFDKYVPKFASHSFGKASSVYDMFKCRKDRGTDSTSHFPTMFQLLLSLDLYRS